VLESNRELVLRRLLECLARDRTKHQVAEVTSLGLVQMTRKRVGAGLLEAFSVPCECCNGRGVIITFDPEADSHAAHHVHPRGTGNGGNASRGSGGGAPAGPAAVAARSQQDGQRNGEGQRTGDGRRAWEGQRTGDAHGAEDGQAESAAAVEPQADGQSAPGQASGELAPSGRSGGRRRRRRSGAGGASAASETSAAPEASPVALPEPQQAQDGAA
jgi:ribonuclease E